MSPINKKKLDLIRNRLDKLDTELLKLIKKRSNLVNDVLKVKIQKKEIIDQRRIKFILKKIKNKSIQLNELSKYVSKNVKDQAAINGREQTPELQGDKNRVLVQFN